MTQVSRIVTVSAALLIMLTSAHAAPTPAQKCAATKNTLAGKYAACLQRAAAAFVISANGGRYATARDKCRTTFLDAWAKADAKAAKAGAMCGDALLPVDAFEALIDGQRVRIENALMGNGLPRCGDGTREGTEECDRDDLGGATCTTRGFALGTLRCTPECAFDSSGCFASRFVDNGDETVTDNLTGLQWEKKARDCLFCAVTEHTVTNRYTWGPFAGCPFDGCPKGDAFYDFLGRLNFCPAWDPTEDVSRGFAGHCDWRLPTILELQTIVDLDACGGGGDGNPCIDPIFGPTATDVPYWSSSTDMFDPNYSPDEFYAWFVDFYYGGVFVNAKDVPYHVRAVRNKP